MKNLRHAANLPKSKPPPPGETDDPAHDLAPSEPHPREPQVKNLFGALLIQAPPARASDAPRAAQSAFPPYLQRDTGPRSPTTSKKPRVTAPKPLLANILGLASGGALAMVINAIAYPVLAHFYGPDEYGDYGLFLFFSGIFSAISVLKFELIIPLQIDDREMSRTVMASLYNAGIIICISFAISFAYYHNGPFLSILLTSLSVASFGVFLTIGAVLVYFRANKTAGALHFIQALTAVTAQIALSGGSFGWYGLAIGYIFSLILSAMVGLAIIALYYKISVSLTALGFHEFLAILGEQKNRWQANFAQTLINAISLNLLAYGCLQTGGKEAVGLFSLCQRIMTIPVRVIGNAVRQVLLREYSATQINPEALKSMTRLAGVLFLTSLLAFSALAVTLPFLVEWLLPGEWIGLNSFIYPVAIWLVFTIAYVPAISMLNALGNNWLHTCYEFANLSQRALVLFALLPLGVGPVEYLYATSLASALLISLFIFSVYFYSLQSLDRSEIKND